jgi:cell wall assembly regulator SMI1
MTESTDFPDIVRVLSDLRRLSEARELPVKTWFYPPASSERFAALEEELCFDAPEDLKRMYSITDGLGLEVLMKRNEIASYIYVLSLDRMITYTKSLEEFTSKKSRSNDSLAIHPYRFVAFADLLDGDVCCFDVDRPTDVYPFTLIPADHGQPEMWPHEPAIAVSFTDWLSRVVANMRKREWLLYWAKDDDVARDS